MATHPRLGRDTPLLKKARERFKLANDADSKQAEREKQDLAFYAGDQWPTDIMLARQGQQPTNGMPAVPSRPTLTINKVREPVRQVQNEIRDSDIGVELTPADDFGDLGVTPDDTEVTLREGLVRRIIRDSSGQDAWNWAGDRADIAGRGYFAVLNRYLPGKTSDQELYLHRIYNQAGVVGDPSRTEPDGSDADWWFVGTWILWDKFLAQYPKDAHGKDNPFSGCSESDFIAMTEEYPTWYRQEGDGEAKSRTVRIVDYWYTEYDSQELVTYTDGSALWADEPPPEGVEEMERRTVPQPSIKFCKIAGGLMILEETDWPGTMMPIIEILGEELHPYDDQKRVEGMVRNARDAQMGFNYMISKQVEQIGLSPIPPLMVDPEAISGFEEFYKVANTRALPYLPYRTRGEGQMEAFAPPLRPPVDPGNLGIAQSIALFDQMIKSTTAVPDPTLGNVDPSLKSGRAIKETVLNAKASTSNFIANRVRSIRRAALVINDALYAIYGTRPGRLVRIMTGEGQAEPMVIGEQAQQQMAMQQKAAKVAKLTKDAKFNVAVKITKNFDTRRQQENSMLGDLIASAPEMMMPVVGDLYMASSDLPSRKQAAERFRVMLAPPIQQLLDQKEQGGEAIPPAAQAKMAEMQQQLQMADQAIKELDQIANGKKLESETKLQVEQMQAERDLALEQLRARTELEKAREDNATKIHIAQIAARTKGVQMAHEAETEAAAMGHEIDMAEMQADREDAARQQEQQHELGMAVADAGVSAEEGERGRQATAQEAEKQRQSASQESEAQRAFEAKQAKQQAKEKP